MAGRAVTGGALLGTCLIIALQLLSVPAVFAQNSVEFSTQEVNTIASHGPWPMVVPPDPGNELSGLRWAEELGEALFFDTSLSSSKAISCGSCHLPEHGFSDKRAVAVGIKQGVRNTQGLLDVGLQRWFGWDGGADSLWAASIRPLLNLHEMGNNLPTLADSLRTNVTLSTSLEMHLSEIAASDGTSSQNPASMAEQKVQPVIKTMDDDALVVLAAKSLAAFMRTIRSGQSEFDLFRQALISGDKRAQSAYPTSAKRGLKIFVGEANCRVCHFGENFSNGEFHDTGRPFFTAVGKVDPGRYSGLQRVRNDPFNLLGKFGRNSSAIDQLKTSEVKLSQLNWGQWRTPSLRNLERTAPYMHDGSLETLRDVVDAYADIDTDRLHTEGESILKPLDLSDDQRNDLVNFLRTLTAVQ